LYFFQKFVNLVKYHIFLYIESNLSAKVVQTERKTKFIP